MSKTEVPSQIPGSFSNLITDALNAAVTPERIALLVSEHVDRLVKEGIEDAMNSWSKTGKEVKAKVAESLQVQGLNLPSYGHVVSQLIERQLQARVAEVIAAKLASDIESLLSLAPKRVKLSELIATLLEEVDDDCSCSIPRVFCKVDVNEYGSVYLSISREEPARHKDPDVRVMIHLPKKYDEYKGSEIPEGTIMLGKVSGSDLRKDIRFGYGTERPNQATEFGRWFGFEQKILAMYACGTIIVLDEDAVVCSKED